MNNYIISGVAGAIVAMSVARCPAGAPTTTNLVQNLNFQLTAYYQASATTNSSSIVLKTGRASVGNRDIIDILGVDLNLIFSSKAKLMVKRQPGEEVGQVFVRDVVNGVTVDTDVGDRFTENPILRVAATTTNLRNKITTGQTFTIDGFVLDTSAGSFNVSGFVNEGIGYLGYAGVYYQFRSGTLKASGTGVYSASPGSTNDVPVVLTGSIGVTGRKIEIK